MPYTYTLNALPEPWEEGRTDARTTDGGMMGRTWKKERRDERERERGKERWIRALF